MSDVVVGVDVGGSKLAVRIESLDGERVVDATVDSRGWEAEPAEAAGVWLRRELGQVLPVGARIAALGVGAQGCDNPDVSEAIREELAGAGLLATVVNDAELLVPAASVDSGIGVIAGTGAIAVGVAGDGGAIAAGGWGWVLGDDAGAAGIVREAVRAVLLAHDAGEPDDGLLGALLRAFGVPTAERLARAVNDNPTVENWAPHAPAVFGAALDGSRLAEQVIERAAEHLSALVDQLRGRGAVGDTVVVAGSVILRQPILREAFARRVVGRHPELVVKVLDDGPVAGAVVLARRLLDGREESLVCA